MSKKNFLIVFYEDDGSTWGTVVEHQFESIDAAEEYAKCCVADGDYASYGFIGEGSIAI